MSNTGKKPEHMKLYNLPQRVEGGIALHGAKDAKNGEDIVLLFHHLDGAYSYCTVQGTDDVVHLSASTPITYSYQTEQYSIDEAA